MITIKVSFVTSSSRRSSGLLPTLHLVLLLQTERFRSRVLEQLRTGHPLVILCDMARSSKSRLSGRGFGRERVQGQLRSLRAHARAGRAMEGAYLYGTSRTFLPTRTVLAFVFILADLSFDGGLVCLCWSVGNSGRGPDRALEFESSPGAHKVSNSHQTRLQHQTCLHLPIPLQQRLLLRRVLARLILPRRSRRS